MVRKPVGTSSQVRRERNRERHAHADVAEVEHRRMDDHQRMVLQQRIRPRPVGRYRRRRRRERIGRAGDQEGEEDPDDEERPEHVAHMVGGARAQVEGRTGGEGPEDEPPEED